MQVLNPRLMRLLHCRRTLYYSATKEAHVTSTIVDFKNFHHLKRNLIPFSYALFICLLYLSVFLLHHVLSSTWCSEIYSFNVFFIFQASKFILLGEVSWWQSWDFFFFFIWKCLRSPFHLWKMFLLDIDFWVNCSFQLKNAVPLLSGLRNF